MCVNSVPGAPEGTHGVEADAGREARVGAGWCTERQGPESEEKILARAPCPCPSYVPPNRVAAIEPTAGPRLGRKGCSCRNEHAISECEGVKKK